MVALKLDPAKLGWRPDFWAPVPPVRSWLRLLWMAGLVYAVAGATHPGTTGRHLAALVLTVTTGLGWAAWLLAQPRRLLWLSVAGVVVIAASGGALVTLHPIGVAVVGVGGLCAASLLTVVPAAIVMLSAPVAAAVAVAVTGHPADVVVSATSGAAAGLIVGMGRRQTQERVRQEAELALAQQQNAVAAERAEVLAERNRLAREVHDVLAHTLSAVSVQLGAVDSLLDGDASATDVRAAVDRSRRLVVDGLAETRRAVQVLRDEPVDAVEQIAALCAESGARFSAGGAPRPLSAAASVALVRVAQEALTNARKHAAGASVAADLEFSPGTVELRVDNPVTAASPLGSSGGGYGLQGMRERLELLDGSLVAGPRDGCWQVHAVLPA